MHSEVISSLWGKAVCVHLQQATGADSVNTPPNTTRSGDASSEVDSNGRKHRSEVIATSATKGERERENSGAGDSSFLLNKSTDNSKIIVACDSIDEHVDEKTVLNKLVLTVL